jgi:hypothetical protein
LQIPAAYLVWRHLPETMGANLDVIDAMDIESAGPRPQRKSVIRVAVLVAVVIGALAFGTGLVRRSTSRPEGLTERWLVAVSETGRIGLRDDALKRARMIGRGEAAAALTSKRSPKDVNRFLSIEVGNQQSKGVPFSVIRRTSDTETDVVRGYANVGQCGNGNDVLGVCSVQLDSSAKVPSNGGTPAAKAPMWLWAAALLISLGLGPLLSALISRMRIGLPV